MRDQELEKINQSYKEKYHVSIPDGINLPDRYDKAKKKILWILKEANDNSGKGGWDLRAFQRDGVTDYPKWSRTYSKIIQVSYGILYNKQCFNELPNVRESLDVLQEIAFINVKKTGGNATANYKAINEFYGQTFDLLHKQIELISPDIIINSSRVWQLFKYLVSNEYLGFGDSCYGWGKNCFVINTFHPNARITHEKYFNEIMGCYKNINIK